MSEIVSPSPHPHQPTTCPPIDPPHAGSGASGAFKVVLISAETGPSQAIAAALLELIDPPADAVSRFEDPAGWRIEAYFQQAPDAAHLAAALAMLLDIPEPSLSVQAVPPENWVTLSQAALPPVIAGRFTVHGSHDRDRVPRGPNSILIDAGEAFGTAHHATTAGCLMAIDRIGCLHRGLHSPRQKPQVLDLGCGSGVLAIAAQRVSPLARVVASDIDPIAIDVARANARRNGATGIAFAVAAGLPRQFDARVRYDLLIANILAGPLIRLAPALAHGVVVGGRLILSGLLTSQAQEVFGAYRPRGFILARHQRIVGWSTLTLVRIDDQNGRSERLTG